MNKILLCLILGIHCSSLAYAQKPDSSTSIESILKMNKKLYDQIVLALPETQSINIPKSLDEEDINTFLYSWLDDSYMIYVETKDWGMPYILRGFNNLLPLKTKNISIEKPLEEAFSIIQKYEEEEEAHEDDEDFESEFSPLDDTDPLIAGKIASHLRNHNLYLIHLYYENNYFIVVEGKEKAKQLEKVLEQFDLPARLIEE